MIHILGAPPYNSKKGLSQNACSSEKIACSTETFYQIACSPNFCPDRVFLFTRSRVPQIFSRSRVPFYQIACSPNFFQIACSFLPDRVFPKNFCQIACSFLPDRVFPKKNYQIACSQFFFVQIACSPKKIQKEHAFCEKGFNSIRSILGMSVPGRRLRPVSLPPHSDAAERN